MTPKLSSNGVISSIPFGFNRYLRWCAKYEGFATFRNVVNLQFVAEVRAEVV